MHTLTLWCFGMLYLETNKFRKAMQEEMGELAKHGVHEQVPVKEC